ncbi:signal peptide peptidase SppA, 67K type [Actinobacillus delphinicola]|uniref:Signal peptide peptidase SppA, 67K type n=2 Tax=Actinobacillus delphinicola TaxID=51161 RepID=A0A448TVK5_9PAST|nr:signal peptide peptidase SppA, 67K type [Actinobacillus delphinicola]
MTFLCKFLWKCLNFIRELVMNIVFLFFVVICAAIFVGVHQLNQW